MNSTRPSCAGPVRRRPHGGFASRARPSAMCGIVGILDVRERREVSRTLLTRMNETQHHRGPDECGLHVEPGVGLGPPAAVDHRHLDRPAAAVQRRPQRRRRIQRRDLQLSGADPGADRTRPSISHAQRHRSHRPRLGSLGRSLCDALSRHVCIRPVGPQSVERCSSPATGWA